MVEINVTYKGQLHCEATHSPSGKQLQTDAPKDNGGKGEFFSPTDLVATALGTCIATIMGIYAQRNNIDLTGLQVKVNKEMSTEPPRRIKRLVVAVNCSKAVSAEQRTGLEKAAQACPVHKSLHPEIEVPVVFHWGG